MISRQSAARRGMRQTLEWLERLKAADVLLFFIGMLGKVFLFDAIINVPNIDMNGYDLVVAIGTLGLVCFWTVWLPARGRIVALISLNVLLSSIMYADVVYYRYFQDLISVPVLMQANQVDSLGASIGTLLQARDFILLADWIVVIPFAFYTLIYGGADLRETFGERQRFGYRVGRRWPRFVARVVTGIAIALIGLSMSVGSINEASRTWAQGLFVNNWWSLSLYNVTGVVGFHGYDVYRYAKENWLDSGQVSAEAAADIYNWTSERSNSRKLLEEDETFGAYKDSNVLMVQVEALQNFMIGKSIGGEEITPNLNKLIQESAYFSQFYHQTSQGRTSDADFLANCSLQPMVSGSVFIQYAGHTFNCLPQTLSDNGYTTDAFHAYDGGFWNRNTMYANMGYDHFYSKKHFTLDEPIGWSLGDKSFFQQSVDVLVDPDRDKNKPFYSFMISLSSHHPFTMPQEQQKLSLGQLEGTLMGDYLQAVHYADAALGELVERLKAEGLWENTIFAMYGDHDNSIKDWELFEQFLGKPLNDLDRQMILKQVPFIVHLPDGAYAGTHANVGGQLDVTPTLLHLLGISTVGDTLLGTPLITEKALSSDSGKLVVQRNGAFTDGTVYFMPSADGIASNGKCWDISSGKFGDIAPCLANADDASNELTMSDAIVTHDLIPMFQSTEAVEATAAVR
ncbi:LTA synthase family protein [Paenibacillus sp. NEAU-GSW1]|uniref:LTA synthase family protein n=1 Tax=Paenibacillus sp. NEAU-GSW1 TaxID=2682486 RepID=UPI0012E1271E|nr:LTA synthase family protein [Paenibacillus sp. NEAU-GSW1]MUT66886.1 sulfatase-like hydrolase/transferase [Paenibacillus sp. NEAU-GSW1]